MTLQELYLIRMILIDVLMDATDITQPEKCLDGVDIHELIMELAWINKLIAQYESSIQMQEDDGVWVIIGYLD